MTYHATHYNMLQHTATHRNTPQHTATHWHLTWYDDDISSNTSRHIICGICVTCEWIIRAMSHIIHVWLDLPHATWHIHMCLQTCTSEPRCQTIFRMVSWCANTVFYFRHVLNAKRIARRVIWPISIARLLTLSADEEVALWYMWRGHVLMSRGLWGASLGRCHSLDSWYWVLMNESCCHTYEGFVRKISRIVRRVIRPMSFAPLLMLSADVTDIEGWWDQYRWGGNEARNRKARRVIWLIWLAVLLTFSADEWVMVSYIWRG